MSAARASPAGSARVTRICVILPGAQMFANRLAKNLKKQQSWAERSGVSCYRLYDADMPEYAFAIDVYRTIGEAEGEWVSGASDVRSGSPAAVSAKPDELTWLYVQEYMAPRGNRARVGAQTTR